MVAIRNLSFHYKPKNPLFTDLSLQLECGHIYGLLGKNGAGKSTLLKNITGLVYPTKGSCMVNGLDISKRPVAALADIYFLPEEIYVPSLSAKVMASRTGSFYPKFNGEQFEEYLKILDVDPLAKMDNLSFGQQKKAMIAFGLATNTGLLIMDEPTNGLDIPSKTQFRKLIASVLTDERCIVISTHQVRDLDSLIDSILVLNDKHIVVNNSIDEVASKLSFGVVADTNGMEVLYEEENMKGKSVITPNKDGRYNKIDLELFFNAVTGGNKQLLEILKTK